MASDSNRSLFIALCSAALLFVGCSRSPTAPSLPYVSAKKAGRQATSLYDTNKDGKIDQEEVLQCPALARMMGRLDADEDQAISASEIAARIRELQESPSRVMPASCQFFLDDKPLVGATVTLEPVEILASSYPTVSAKTDEEGLARLTSGDPRYPGVFVGLYTIRVSKEVDGQEIIPVRYNAQTQLGCEISKREWFTGLFGYRLNTDGMDERN